MNQKCVPGPFPFTSQSLGGAETIWQMPALRSIMLLLEIPLPYIEKNETIFYPPAILRSTCVACRGCLLARSILPQPKQSCSLTMQKPAEQKVIPFIYSGSCWSGQHERGVEAVTVLSVMFTGCPPPAEPNCRQAQAHCPDWGNAPAEFSQSLGAASRVARRCLC